MPGKRADGVHMRGIPVHDDLWTSAMAKAKAEGVSLYALIRQWLREYVAK
ncbi:hypothetical protein ACBJ59_10895 [Nonomuraea sp. MTCD27]